MVDGTDNAPDLPHRVELCGVRWHQRVAVRRWPDADPEDAPFQIEFSPTGSARDSDDGKGPVRLAVDMNIGLVGDQHGVSLRGALKLDTEHLLAVHDAEIRVLFAADDTPSDDELIDFAQNWGHDYLFGYLRAGLADSAALIGLRNLVLPPSPLTRPTREGAIELLELARRREITDRDAEQDDADAVVVDQEVTEDVGTEHDAVDDIPNANTDAQTTTNNNHDAAAAVAVAAVNNHAVDNHIGADSHKDVAEHDHTCQDDTGSVDAGLRDTEHADTDDEVTVPQRVIDHEHLGRPTTA